MVETSKQWRLGLRPGPVAFLLAQLGILLLAWVLLSQQTRCATTRALPSQLQLLLGTKGLEGPVGEGQ